MSKLKIMYFSAPWCGPCKAFKPVFTEVVEEFNDIEVQHVDVDNESQLAADYAVRSIPTLVFIKDDKEVSRSKGLMTRQNLVDLIKNNK